MKFAVVLLIISLHTVMADGDRNNIGKDISVQVNKYCNPVNKPKKPIQSYDRRKQQKKEVKETMEFLKNSAVEFLDEYRYLNHSLTQSKIYTDIKLGCQPNMSSENNTRLHVLIRIAMYSIALEKNKDIKVKKADRDSVKLYLSQVACKIKQLLMSENVSGLDTIINSMVARKKKDIGKIISEKIVYNLIHSADQFVSSVQFSDDYSMSVANSDHCVPGGKKMKKNVKKSKGKTKQSNKTKQRNSRVN